MQNPNAEDTKTKMTLELSPVQFGHFAHSFDERLQGLEEITKTMRKELAEFVGRGDE
jgi:hypothetical protein